MQFTDFQNIHAMLRQTVDRTPDGAGYRWFTGPGTTESITWEGFGNAARFVGKSLMALGVSKGDAVSILSYSCYHWVLTDLGITGIGAVTVGIYQSNLAKDCRYIIDHSEAVLAFAENPQQLAKLISIRPEIPRIRKIVLFNGTPPAGSDDVIDFDTFLSLGYGVSDEEFSRRTEAVRPGDAAGIVYTSGTTGVPKGAVLTHDNITFTAQSVRFSTAIRDGDESFLFLPLAHVFARTCVYATMLAGSTTTFARSMDTVVEDIRFARPHWFASVPRIYEKIHARVLGAAEAKGGMTRQLFDWACGVGGAVSDGLVNKEPIPLKLRIQYGIATGLVFSKIKSALGGRVRWCISGAAPLNPEIGRFFHAAGILILEGLGMTENTSFTNLNPHESYRFGWVGPTGPGIEQKIADDGEVLFRGRNVMRGYYKMPEETAAAIDADGWLHSGDLGEIDAAGFLRITGRKKELIITAGGKNIAPSPIEGVLATSQYIHQVCVVGDRRRYLSALVSLDPENVAEWAETNGIVVSGMDELIREPRVQALIEAEVAEKNKQFASYETIKKVTIVPECTIENGLLTPTLKLKKSQVMDRYKEAIEAMYPTA